MFKLGRMGSIAAATVFVLGFSAVVAPQARAQGFTLDATATVSDTTPKVGAKVTARGVQTFSAWLGPVPLPELAYYKNSFPTSFAQPTLSSVNVGLDSTAYQKRSNKYLGKTQWEVWGTQTLLGDLTAKISGYAKASKAGSGTKFYVGTDECLKQFPSCYMAHATKTFTISK